MKYVITKKSNRKTFVKRDVYQEVTDKIIAALESGCAPWIKPWKDSNTGASLAMPHNASTGRAYSGINVMLLWCEASEKDYQSHGWMTYNQANKVGGQVRKGEKATLVTLFKPFEVTENAGTPEEKKKKCATIKGFSVFNVAQIDFPEDAKIYSGENIPAFEGTTVSEITERVGAKMVLGGNKACFIPSHDQINMPHLKQFKDEDQFDSTLAHELTHWTGHKARLDRTFGERFGDVAYAFEELVAELGSAFLCAQLGIVNEELRHDSYIENWIQKLKEDKKAIFTASSAARQANEFIIENSQEK